VWCGVAVGRGSAARRCGAVWRGAVLCGVARCGAARCGVARWSCRCMSTPGTGTGSASTSLRQ
jgi:hypothetical protein